MDAGALLDTGAIYALLSRTDHWHRACVAAYREFDRPLVTSQAVLTELFYFTRGNRLKREAAWGLLGSGSIRVADIRSDELPRVQALMAKYADRPMDFADATLVHLAERDGLSDVFTVDHADFSTYRIHGRKRFRIVPEARA